MDSSRTSINDLAKSCAHSADATEWEEFMRRCARLVSLVAWRVCRLWTNGASAAIVDDIVQEVFLKLCEQDRRILREFEPRGDDSFLGLLRVISASVANDYFRRSHSAKRGGKVVTTQLGEEELVGQGASVHFTAQEAGQMHRSVLLTQLDRMLRSEPKIVGERDRAFFWLYYLQGFTAEEIAGFTGDGLTAKGVESALRRTTIWLRAEVAQPKVGEADSRK
jgi:RNA polymerase sigma-70 factor (ECF subfamily)